MKSPSAHQFLPLKDRKPLTMGRSRLVFEHPDNPSFLVKVMRADVLDERFGSGVPWYKRRRRYRHLVSYVREIQEYVAVYAAHDCAPHFLQKVDGLVETDLGLGLITGAARDKNGDLAPSLGTLIASGRFDSAARQNLETFFQQLLECAVIVSDLNAQNLVYAHTAEHGNHFVLIDGLGNANPLPFKILSRRINRRSKQQRFARLYNRIETRLKKAGYPMPPLPEMSS